jgi:hypothetical protein
MAKRSKSNDDDDVVFAPKWKKHLPTGWTDTADSYSEEDLKKAIVDCQTTISNVEKDMDKDEKLKVLKEELRDISGGFKDLIKANEAKMRYCVHVLRSRGQA